jgi:hypothetical protein
MHKYDISFISYNAPFIIPSNCNSITFLNVGTATAFIEGVPIISGSSITIDGNECEYSETYYSLTFDTTGGGTQNFVAIKKTYVK